MPRADPEERRAYQRAYYIANKERKWERLMETNRAWKAANKEHIAEWNRQYRQLNRDRESAVSKLWYQANKEHATAMACNRRARRRNVEGIVSGADIRDLLDAQAWCCAYCGCDVAEGYHVDHVLPFRRGGTNTRENLAIACPTCNLSKGTKTLEEWLE